MKAVVFVLGAALVGCGGSSADVGGAGGSSGSSRPSGGVGSSGGSGTVNAGGVGGPTLTLSLRGSITAVSHIDGFAGETPRHQIAAIKTLLLYRTMTDLDPVKVFDLAERAVEADLVTGDTIDIATVPLRSIPAGTYTYAKVGTAYVKYTVDSRLHSTLTVDGQYNNIEALSDGALIDGIARKKGWYRFQFAQGGTTYGTVEGDDAPIPAVPAGGGITLDSSGVDSYYAFPALVVIDPTATIDQRAICDVNVHESFRWMDQAEPRYAAGVYDTTATTYEPVMSFGANSFALSLEAK